MEILSGIEIKNKSLWLKESRTLIIADFHIGYEEALANSGVLVPRVIFKDIIKDIKELLKLNPKLVIINGDLKHEFGKISRQEWQDSLEILDLFLKKSKVILIKGNHDTVLEPIAKKKNVKIVNFFITKNIAVLHGHKIFLECLNKKIKNLIIAHEHPSIFLREGVKQEKYKCFLLGKYKKKNLIVMPSFMNFPEGANIQKERMLSPFLQNIKNFKVFVVRGEVYDFGKIKDI